MLRSFLGWISPGKWLNMSSSDPNIGFYAQLEFSCISEAASPLCQFIPWFVLAIWTMTWDLLFLTFMLLTRHQKHQPSLRKFVPSMPEKEKSNKNKKGIGKWGSLRLLDDWKADISLIDTWATASSPRPRENFVYLFCKNRHFISPLQFSHRWTLKSESCCRNRTEKEDSSSGSAFCSLFPSPISHS